LDVDPDCAARREITLDLVRNSGHSVVLCKAAIDDVAYSFAEFLLDDKRHRVRLNAIETDQLREFTIIC